MAKKRKSFSRKASGSKRTSKPRKAARKTARRGRSKSRATVQRIQIVMPGERSTAPYPSLPKKKVIF